MVDKQSKNDPFDPNHPLDADKFCDDLHRYWSIHFKNKKVTKDKNKNKGGKNQQNRQKKPRHNNGGGHTGDNSSHTGLGGSQGRGGNNDRGD